MGVVIVKLGLFGLGLFLMELGLERAWFEVKFKNDVKILVCMYTYLHTQFTNSRDTQVTEGSG